MIFVTNDLGITLTDSHLCHNLTDLQSIPFRSTSNSVVLFPVFSLLTVFLQNSSPFWCDLSNGISNTLCVRFQVDFRWWTSLMIFLMPSSRLLAVGLLSLGSAYRPFCFNLDIASATTFFFPAICLNTMLNLFNSNAHLFRVRFFMLPEKKGTRGLWSQ